MGENKEVGPVFLTMYDMIIVPAVLEIEKEGVKEGARERKWEIERMR